jgi:hypothetical protein
MDPATALDTLVLKVCAAFDIYTLPNGLFAEHVPVLRSLHLENCVIQWGSALFSNLTHIAVVLHAYNRDKFRLSLSTMMARLRDLPRLQSLRLEYCTAIDGDSFTQKQMQDVHLPLLATLQLSDEIVIIIDILKYLRIPATAFVTFMCVSASADDLDVSALYSTIGRSNGGYRQTLIQSLCVEQACNDSGIKFLASTKEYNVSDGPPSADDADMVVNMLWAMDRRASPQMLDLFKIAPLDGVLDLYIFDVDPISATVWLDMASLMVQLRLLHVQGSAFRGIMEAFRLAEADEEKAAFLPMLSTLILEKVILDDEISGMANMLGLRGQLGSAVRNIVIKSSIGIEQWDINRLRDVVADVKWDGVNGWTSDEDDIPIEVEGRSHYAAGYYSMDEDD